MCYSSSVYIERRATYYGFIIYMTLVFLLPFVLMTIARHVDHAFMHNYIAPYSQYKIILIVLAGFFTGMLSQKHPFVNSVFVGMLGLLTWLIFSSISVSMTESLITIETLLYQSTIRLSLCAAGGFCVMLYRRVVAGFNK